MAPSHAAALITSTVCASAAAEQRKAVDRNHDISDSLDCPSTVTNLTNGTIMNNRDCNQHMEINGLAYNLVSRIVFREAAGN